MARSQNSRVTQSSTVEEVGAWHLLLDRRLGRIRSIGGEGLGPLWGPDWGGVRLQRRSLSVIGASEWTTVRHTVLLCQAGRLAVRLLDGGPGGEEILVPGRLAVVADGERVQLEVIEGCQVLGASLDPVYVQAVSGGRIEAGGLVLGSRVGVRDELVAGLMEALVEEVGKEGGGGWAYTDSLASCFALRVATAYRAVEGSGLRSGAGRAVPFLVRKAIAYLHSRITEDVTLGELARHVGQSPFHFARTFKDAVGYAPHQYIIRQRVERAKQILLAGQRSPAEVAGEVGFCDQSHLTRHFKRVTGTTPSAFMQRAVGRGRFTRPVEEMVSGTGGSGAESC